MSCSAVAFTTFLWFAATGPVAPTAHGAQSPAAVVQEPLLVDIISRASALKVEVETFRGNDKAVPATFTNGIGELAALDMKAHVLLKERGSDGDLKCILKGISEDLPLKLQALTAATTRNARDAAVLDMGYLLNDNVEVITAPPATPV